MSPEVNSQAADQLMAVGAETMSKAIKTEADAKRAEKIQRVENILVTKLIPMKKAKRIDSRQFIKATIQAGHKLGLGREESLGAILALEKVDQLLQARTKTGVMDYYDVEYKKAQIRGTNASAAVNEAKLNPQGLSYKETLEIGIKEQKLESDIRANKEARRPLATKLTEKELAEQTAKTAIAATNSLRVIQDHVLATEGMSANDKLEYLNDELGSVYEESGVESSFWEFNRPESFDDLAKLLAKHLDSTDEFQTHDEREIKSALLSLFDDPNERIGGVLGRLLQGAPRGEGGITQTAIGKTVRRVK